MADGIKISALTEATDAQTVDGNLLETAVVDSSSSTGFSSKKTPISRLAKYVLDKYIGLSLGGSARTVKTAIDALQTDVDKKADADGEYDDLVVGTSKQLLSESYTEDFTPYKYRKSPSTDRLSESIVGASVVWNQLVYYPDNTVTLSRDSQRTASVSTNNVKSVISHIYLIMLDIIADSSNNGLRAQYGAGTQFEQGVGHKSAIMKATGESSYLYVFISNAEASGAEISFKNINIIDLTTMFGSTVADALYAMGADGIALFRSWYPEAYYPYTEATLEHVSGLEAHEMVGFNQWDEVWESGTLNSSGQNVVNATRIRSKNYIPVISGETYYCRSSRIAASVIWCEAFDEDKHILPTAFDGTYYKNINNTEFVMPSEAKYIRFVVNDTEYNNDICINISDPLRNGQYKPYESHSYALDASLTLRGLLKYDSAKGFYADGDVYASDGTVTRRYGIRAYQSGDESDTAVLTDGTNTVYKLTTATTESAEPFDAIQITDGTEEYVTDCMVPVGHESKYYQNLRSKIEGLPTDFSAIICATEATNKASRNYAVGDYLIYNNTLYKVTAAIAANAALTVGTNISATTIMAEIKALQ